MTRNQRIKRMKTLGRQLYGATNRLSNYNEKLFGRVKTGYTRDQLKDLCEKSELAITEVAKELVSLSENRKSL